MTDPILWQRKQYVSRNLYYDFVVQSDSIVLHLDLCQVRIFLHVFASRLHEAINLMIYTWYASIFEVVVCIIAETKFLCSTSQGNPICRDWWTRYRRSKSLPQRRLETLTQKVKRRLAFSNYVTTNGGIANMEDIGNMQLFWLEMIEGLLSFWRKLSSIMIRNLFLKLSSKVGFNRKASVFELREWELSYCNFISDGDYALLIQFIME